MYRMRGFEKEIKFTIGDLITSFSMRKLLYYFGVPLLAGSIALTSSCKKQDPELEQIIQELFHKDTKTIVLPKNNSVYVNKLLIDYDADFSEFDDLWKQHVTKYDGKIEECVEKLYFALTGREIPGNVKIEVLKEADFNRKWVSKKIEARDIGGFVDYDRFSLTTNQIKNCGSKIMPTKYYNIYIKERLFHQVSLMSIHELGHVSCPDYSYLGDETAGFALEMCAYELLSSNSENFKDAFLYTFLWEGEKSPLVEKNIFKGILGPIGCDKNHAYARLLNYYLYKEIGFDGVYESMADPYTARENTKIIKKALKEAKKRYLKFHSHF